MRSHKSGPIKYYTFPCFDNRSLYHAVFTRHGGVSPTPWKSLNFGASVGDDVNRVSENRNKALAIIGINPESVYDVYQVHSINIIKTIKPLGVNEPHIKADAIITNIPGVTLMMRFADCVPIFLFDPINRAIGIAHAGWIGTINNIAGKTVQHMGEHFGTKPADIIAAIGPSIGPDHYIVGSEVVEKVVTRFGTKASQIITNDKGKSFLDLWKANQISLNEIGVTQIEIAEICTCCNLEEWYSHRGEHGKTGRFGAVLGIY